MFGKISMLISVLYVFETFFFIKGKVVLNALRLKTVIVLVSSGRLCKYSMFYSDQATRLERFANLALWFVPEGAQSAWTLQETHCNSTSYSRDETRTSELLLDRQTP